MITPAAEHYARELDRLAPGAARVTNKLPMNVAILGFFAAMFPRGRVVHCRRDPRDVGLSCYFRDFHAPTPYAVRPEWIGEYYRGYARLVGHWRDTFAKLSDPPGVVEVTYEEFVRDPEGGARALVAGVGLAWDDACVAPVQDDRLEITQRADQSGRGVYGSSVGRHEHYAAHTGVWRDLVAPSFSDG
ncbi:MAG: sulfotransferase [Phycisphaerales bacterium]